MINSSNGIKFNVTRHMLFGNQKLQLEIRKNGFINILNEIDNLYKSFPISDISLIQDAKIDNLTLRITNKRSSKSFTFKFSDFYERYLFKTLLYNRIVKFSC